MADRKITDLGAAENTDLTNANTVLPIVNPDRVSNIDKNRKATFGQIATAMVEQGLVEGPAASTTGRVAVFDDTSGTLLRDGTKLEVDLVTGPASSTGDTVALFDGSTGTVLKSGGKANASLVEGPASATSGRVAVFNGTSGKLLQNGTKLEADLVVGPASATSDTVALFDGTTGKVVKGGGKANANLVEGPASATSGRVAVFDGTTGKLLQDGVKLEADLVTGPGSVAAGRVAAFNGTTGKVVQEGVGDGAVGTPSVTFASDLNTGMWRPAADTIAFSTNGAERVRVDSSGNVGIGTTSPAGPLDVVVSSTNDAYNAAIFTGNNAGGGQGGQIGSRTISGNTTQGLYVHSVNSTTVSAGVSLRFQVGTLPATATDTSTERMRISSTGNVGIGTTSPVALGTNYTTLDIRGTTGGGHRFGNSTDSGLVYADSTATILGTVTSKPLSLVTNNTVKMSIASDGKVGIGTTSPATTLDVNGDVTITDKIIHSGDTNTAIRFPAADTVAVETAGSERMRIRDNGVIAMNTTANAIYNMILRVNGGIESHSIQFNMATPSSGTNFDWVLRVGSGQRFFVDNGTVVASLTSAGVWTNASDARHKENIRPVPYGLNEVLELKPRAYNMRNDKTEQIGFIAQEVEPVLPELVESVHNDVTGEDRYTLSYSQMSAVLVKAIQELKAELDAVKVELASAKECKCE